MYVTLPADKRSTSRLLDGSEAQPLKLYKLEPEIVDYVDPSIRPRYQRGLRYIGQAYGEVGQPPRYGLSFVDSSVVSHKLNKKIVDHLSGKKAIVSFRELEDSVEVTSHQENAVLINLELGRMARPLALQEGTEIFFNDIDGIRVDSVLERGYSEEQLEHFISSFREDTWLDIVNR